MKCAFEGLTTALVIGIGASVTALLDFITYSSLLRKGFRFQLRSPFNGLHGISLMSSIDEINAASEKVSSDVSLGYEECLKTV
ncbi:Hypothetical predicted protein [Olea europaea subsp. europaea]|uniref:Uncharacterized protein n=1 Tax=Olea europaea subsp. europaea TaxID=158383 RepID=A0A8S0Q6Z0_OLEEU|nr:Hypothetical predicted protein [Olea europaea subsp. europaea]